MNLNRRFLSVLALSLLVIPGLTAETVIDQLFGLRKYELADAYYAAGQKFIDLGEADRGAAFKAQALRLFPGYVPGQAPSVTAASLTPATPKPEPQLPSSAVVREQNLQGEKIARLQFQKLLRGYLTGNAATILSALAQPDAGAVAAFLQAHPADAGSPEELFLLETLTLQSAADDSVVITVQANPESSGLAAFVPFWKPTQIYTFNRVGDTWKLAKVVGN